MKATDSDSILAAIQSFNADRVPDLVRLKLKRMNENVFSFFRGTDELFGTAWRNLQPRDAGPAIQCSGDLHLENFGACQSETGDFRFEINDFDDAVIAPCSFDLVRCTASILLAGEDWGLTPLTATGIALAFLEQYQRAVIESVATGVTGAIGPRNGEGPVWDLLNVTAQGSEARLLELVTRIKKNGEREIIRSAKKHPGINSKRQQQIRKVVEQFGQADGKPHAFHVVDVTGRIAGIGSLGLHRYTVLIATGHAGQKKHRLLDLKEARQSVVADAIDLAQPRFPMEAERVIAAQRELQSQPALGLGAVSIGDVSYRVREMIPDENRSNLDRLHKKPKQLKLAVEVVGQLVGWSQVRGAARPGDTKVDQRPALAEWARGPGIDAVLAAAVRIADLTRTQYSAYHREYARRK